MLSRLRFIPRIRPPRCVSLRNQHLDALQNESAAKLDNAPILKYVKRKVDERNKLVSQVSTPCAARYTRLR